MVFSSLLFVFAFLTICYALYALMPGIRSRNVMLLVASLIFYAWGGPSLVLLLMGMTFICYLGGLLIEKKPTQKKLTLTITLVISIGLLAVYKYTGFLLSNFKLIFGVPKVIPNIALPIGISFYTFQLISYVIDVYRGEVAAQKKYHLLLLYASLFHQCIAGPIIRYSDVNEEIINRTVTREGMARGISRFAVGLSKKALLANGCASMVSALIEKPEDLTKVSGASILLAMLAYMLEIYLDFSAYSDMAIGMGEMIGFHYKENFNYPYVAHSVTDFWRRWHISLSGFFRDYVYIPLGGNRVSIPRQIFNLFAVWALTGLWHGASWNFVLWGLYYFVFLIFEKFVIRLKKVPNGALTRIPRTIYTLTIVFFGWLLFYWTDMSSLIVAIKGIFTLNGNNFWDMTAQSQLLNNIFFLIVSIIACTPFIPFIANKFENLRNSKKRLATVAVGVYDIITAIIPVVLLFASTLALVGDSYNPFLYFRF